MDILDEMIHKAANKGIVTEHHLPMEGAGFERSKFGASFRQKRMFGSRKCSEMLFPKRGFVGKLALNKASEPTHFLSGTIPAEEV